MLFLPDACAWTRCQAASLCQQATIPSELTWRTPSSPRCIVAVYVS
jgi:hypothetical protein